MKHLVICIALLTVGACCFAQQKKVASHKATSGNPVFQGWYADPEGIIYDDTYWIFQLGVIFTKIRLFRLFLFQRSCELDETCFSFGHYCRKMG